eukprot:scaffold57877_cov41-Cyclotella_meneghiniana.AAC.3
MYRGDEKYDWAEVGPLPRGGKGKKNKNKRKRSERDGDEMSKRRGWVYDKEYVKIDSSTGVQPRVTKMPMFESYENKGIHGQPAQGESGPRPQSTIGQMARGTNGPRAQKKEPMMYELLPELNAASQLTHRSNGHSARSSKLSDHEMMLETEKAGQQARSTNGHEAQSTDSHMARGAKCHTECSVLSCKKQRVYEMLSEGGCSPQTTAVRARRYNEETWMERARDEYLEMVSPKETMKKGDIQYDQHYLWSHMSDEATASTADMTDDDLSDDKEEENWQWMESIALGLEPSTLWSGERVSGANKAQHRRQNKLNRIEKQEKQREQSYWTTHEGKFSLPMESKQGLSEWKGSMCPSNLALHHPAAKKLLQYATGGCPCNTGKPWTKDEIWAAVERGPHVSALKEDAIEQLEGEIAEKVRVGQCKVVDWDDIKNDSPKQLKVSPLAMIPHKSRKYRAILDLSFRIRLKCGREVPSVNEATTLEAPSGAIDQLGHSLQRIIHAFAEADEDAKIFMPSLISRMAFGGWFVQRVKNGTSRMCYHKKKASQHGW